MPKLQITYSWDITQKQYEEYKEFFDSTKERMEFDCYDCFFKLSDFIRPNIELETLTLINAK